MYVINQKAGLSRNNFLIGSIFGLIVRRVAAEQYTCFLFFVYGAISLCRSGPCGARSSSHVQKYAPVGSPWQNPPGCARSLLSQRWLELRRMSGGTPDRREVGIILRLAAIFFNGAGLAALAPPVTYKGFSPAKTASLLHGRFQRDRQHLQSPFHVSIGTMRPHIVSGFQLKYGTQTLKFI